MQPSRIAILGSGPAGLGAAYRLTQSGKAQVTVLERQNVAGGLAGGFELAGIKVDYGSHRLHPSCDPAILADIQRFLGNDLLDRPRHGRIRLRKRWIHFPLKPVDLMLSLPPGFAFGTMKDMLGKVLPAGKPPERESFASVLHRGLGPTICRDFYFPYARKIWGREPEELSAIQARRRVKAGSLGKMLGKVLSAVPGFKPRGAGRFWYPRGGFMQIVGGYEKAARDQGADLRLGAGVEAIHLTPSGAEVEYRQNGQPARVAADMVWSTIPLPVLARSIRPEAPADILSACDQIHYRSMILIYLVVGQPRFSEYDAHYFPEADVPLTRMSEPKNYSTVNEPTDRTVLCAELPCSQSDALWTMSDKELGEVVRTTLERLGIPLTGPVLEVVTRRMPQAYPIYVQGYEKAFDAVDNWVSGLPAVLTLGRQGLFAHDNTHHTLAMAYAAADCLDAQGRFDRERWQKHRKEFESHVVED